MQADFTDERRLSFYLTTDHLLRCRDTDGRPLGEQKLPLEERADVPMKTARCPYPGSRHQHELPMNMSAFEQVSRAWQQTLEGIEYLRRAHLSRVGGPPPGEPVGLEDGWMVGTACTVACNFLLYRAREPYLSGTLPAPVSVLYKVGLGLFSSMESMALQRMLMGAYAPTDTATVEELHELLENLGIFISHAGVCAGPPAMVNTSLKAITHGQPGDLEAGALRAIFPDPGPLLDFAAEWRALRGVVFALTIRMHLLRGELGGAWEMAEALPEIQGGFGQLSQLVVGLEPEAREHVLSSLATTMPAELRAEFSAAFETGANLAAPAWIQRLRDAAVDLSPEVREQLPRLAAEALHLESRGLALLEQVHVRLSRALGFTAVRPWDRSQLVECLGDSPLSLLAKACGLSAEAVASWRA